MAIALDNSSGRVCAMAADANARVAAAWIKIRFLIMAVFASQ